MLLRGACEPFTAMNSTFYDLIYIISCMQAKLPSFAFIRSSTMKPLLAQSQCAKLLIRLICAAHSVFPDPLIRWPRVEGRPEATRNRTLKQGKTNVLFFLPG